MPIAHISPIRSGISSSTIQAPSANLATPTITATTPVATAPAPFSVARQRQPRTSVRSFHQCRTIPDWLSVNAMKTPTV